MGRVDDPVRMLVSTCSGPSRQPLPLVVLWSRSVSAWSAFTRLSESHQTTGNKGFAAARAMSIEAVIAGLGRCIALVELGQGSFSTSLGFRF